MRSVKKKPSRNIRLVLHQLYKTVLTVLKKSDCELGTVSLLVKIGDSNPSLSTEMSVTSDFKCQFGA